MPPTIAYLIRGVAVGAQAASGTPAALSAPNWLNWCTRAQITDEIPYDFPLLLAYRVWLRAQGIPLTRMVRWEIDVLADTWQWGWFLMNYDGSPTGTGPYLFTPGKNAGKLLTITKLNKNLTTYRQVQDGMCTDVGLEYDVKMVPIVKCKGLGILTDPLGSPPTPSYGTIGDRSPLRNFWAVVSLASAATGVEKAKFDLNQKVDPFFTSPTAAPGPSTPAGVSPSDWEVLEMGLHYDILRKYGADAGSGLYAFRHDNALLSNSFSAIDPVTAGGKGVVITLPVLKSGTGVEEDVKPISREHLTGEVLYDAGTAGGGTFSFYGDAGFTPS